LWSLPATPAQLAPLGSLARQAFVWVSSPASHHSELDPQSASVLHTHVPLKPSTLLHFPCEQASSTKQLPPMATDPGV
jgi:hypothetical protein